MIHTKSTRITFPPKQEQIAQYGNWRVYYFKLFSLESSKCIEKDVNKSVNYIRLAQDILIYECFQPKLKQAMGIKIQNLCLNNIKDLAVT